MEILGETSPSISSASKSHPSVLEILGETSPWISNVFTSHSSALEILGETSPRIFYGSTLMVIASFTVSTSSSDTLT